MTNNYQTIPIDNYLVSFTLEDVLFPEIGITVDATYQFFYLQSTPLTLSTSFTFNL